MAAAISSNQRDSRNNAARRLGRGAVEGWLRDGIMKLSAFVKRLTVEVMHFYTPLLSSRANVIKPSFCALRTASSRLLTCST